MNTCADGDDDINKRERSNQLTINGAIIAGKLLDLKRTYGAAKGVNSGVPAEIINFDPTFYLWGSADAEKQENKEYTTVYTAEVAPRI